MPLTMIVPMLVCRNPEAEIEFCKYSFDAAELSRKGGEEGGVIHATLKIGQMMVMIHNETSQLASRAPHADGSSPVVIYLYSDEVDPIIEKAVTKGARVILPAQNKFWGDRVGRIIDPENHVWNIACRIDPD
jgi:uncharacterized glyoxalase superfamily protein PhnB